MGMELGHTISSVINHTQDEVNPIKSSDYVGQDGLVVCGVCGKPKQHRLIIKEFHINRIVPQACDCDIKRREEEKRIFEYNETMRRINQLKESSMMASNFKNAAFAEYIIRDENKLACKVACKYCKNWADMKTKNQGLLFWGPVGTGKSWTAACIANYLLNKQVSVIMTSFVKILQDIQRSNNEADYLRILNSASLLIIDDLGAERSTDYALEKVYNVIDSRVRTVKPMILTTNLDVETMQQCDDIRYKRIYDRIFEVCLPVNIKGESFRADIAEKRFADMQKLIEE